jgi:excisionase family DNA binding protein
MERLLRVAEVARLLGVHPQTLKEWERQGRLHSIRTPGGRRRIPEGEVLRLQGRAAGRPPATGAIYARVSSQDQKARGDLARQIAHLRERLARAGGLSDKRRGLLTLTDLARRGETWPEALAASTARGWPVVGLDAGAA